MTPFLATAFLLIQTMMPWYWPTVEKYHYEILPQGRSAWIAQAHCGEGWYEINEGYLRAQYPEWSDAVYYAASTIVHEVAHLEAGVLCQYETPARTWQVIALDWMRAPGHVRKRAAEFRDNAITEERLPPPHPYWRVYSPSFSAVKK